MKAITIRQPFAWAIVHAGKDCENRVWPTHYRGPILIHAAKGMTHEEYDDFASLYADYVEIGYYADPPALPSFDEFRAMRGGLFGMANIDECVTDYNSPWFIGPYAFVLSDVRPMTFHPIRGQLGIFNVPHIGGVN